MAYLVKPVKETDLQTAIDLALTRFEQLQGLRQEAATLRQALGDRKPVERSKGIVMRRLGVPEEDAYRRLRKLSSDQNRKLSELARAILAAEEIFSALEEVGGEGQARARARAPRNGTAGTPAARRAGAPGETQPAPDRAKLPAEPER
jgi:YesN/AraC family two-component response regulator